MNAIQQLKSFDATLYTVEELALLAANAEGMRQVYAKNDLEEPEWLKDAGEAISKEIVVRSRDQMEKELKEIDGRMEALKTADEKRKDLAAKQERLKAKLGSTKPA